MSRKIAIVLCTFPNETLAESVAETLVTEQLAACVNLLPAVRSIYQWEGNVEKESETLAMIKSTESGFPALEKRLTELHPYEVPEIIAITVNDGNAGYLQWVSDCVQSAGTG